ncbi:extracellular solute-binding protein [Paenibacillus flagellatus]|uniref:ABC transporter substrate-binding protein n=1 Tax=Paenibacillus flagellatus TaxID=2211139 RepID=A0A2V5L135_9BACL|nr:extracellular solute-binding protein [Paenibacillus flagellatus]PYI56386.1 ABC transporter substrate-binding protein [Paenibacillus flagellatus]
MKTKTALIAIVAVAALGGTVACSTGGKDESGSGPAGGAQAQPDDKSKTYAITYLDGTYASPVPPSDSPGIQMINDKFNVDFKTEFVPYSEYGQKLPVKMASGDIPDVIGMETADSNYYKWAKQGAFLPLDSYIDRYPTLKMVPQFVWDAMKVDGKVYGIPRYFPMKYGKQPMIRKDWLDKLGLKVPTNFEELKQVAIAFAKNDPDGNGKDDTYGIMLAKGIQYDFDFGVYWNPAAWYHTNRDGQTIPGLIADASKERIQMLADLYKAGAIPKDWAVAKISDVKKAFYAGKFGIFYEQPYDKWPTDFRTLQSIDPKAELVPIPPFKAPDGTQGFNGLTGYYQIFTLNAKLKDDPGKVTRFLEMNDYFRKFIPVDQRTAQNPDYDWQNGKEGVGYKIVNGNQENTDFGQGLQPRFYLESRYWAPNDEANEVSKVAVDPLQKSLFSAMETMLKNYKVYINPINRIKSEKFMEKWGELEQLVRDEQTKMIVGQSSVADWDGMVRTFLAKGGKEVIDEVNKAFKDAGIKGEWQ